MLGTTTCGRRLIGTWDRRGWKQLMLTRDWNKSTFPPTPQWIIQIKPQLRLPTGLYVRYVTSLTNWRKPVIVTFREVWQYRTTPPSHPRHEFARTRLPPWTPHSTPYAERSNTIEIPYSVQPLSFPCRIWNDDTWLGGGGGLYLLLKQIVVPLTTLSRKCRQAVHGYLINLQ